MIHEPLFRRCAGFREIPRPRAQNRAEILGISGQTVVRLWAVWVEPDEKIADSRAFPAVVNVASFIAIGTLWLVEKLEKLRLAAMNDDSPAAIRKVRRHRVDLASWMVPPFGIAHQWGRWGVGWLIRNAGELAEGGVREGF